jgi:hypothetical protein
MDQLNMLRSLVDAVIEDRDPRDSYWTLKGRPKRSDPEYVLKRLYALILLSQANARGEARSEALFETVARESGLTFDVVKHLYRDSFNPKSGRVSKSEGRQER